MRNPYTQPPLSVLRYDVEKPNKIRPDFFYLFQGGKRVQVKHWKFCLKSLNSQNSQPTSTKPYQVFFSRVKKNPSQKYGLKVLEKV